MYINQNLQPTLRSTFRAAYNRYIAKRRMMVSNLYMENTIDTLESEDYWLGDIPEGINGIFHVQVRYHHTTLSNIAIICSPKRTS